jgi:histidyl-tRNA synthetase
VGARKATARVLVAVIDPELRQDCLQLAYELRRAGIPTELYLGEERGIGRQLKYADQWEVPITLLYGGNEKARGMVTLKDMEAGRAKAQKIEGREEWIAKRPGQREVERSALVATVREMLGAIEEDRR